MPKKKKPKARADKETVFATLDDLVANLLIHDREGDEDLPQGEIEKMISSETLSVDDLVDRFRDALEEHLEDLESAEGEDEDEDEDEGPLELDDEDD
jgi:hypothetical protein